MLKGISLSGFDPQIKIMFYSLNTDSLTHDHVHIHNTVYCMSVFGAITLTFIQR